MGSSVFFPATAMMSSTDKSGSLIYVVPQDDEHTWFLLHMARPAQRGAASDTAPFYDVPGVDDSGRFMIGTANGQDNMAVSTQGASTRRDLEHLGSSDLGIILYRQMALEQVALVEDGGEPMNVLRDRAMNRRIDLPAPVAASSGQRNDLVIRA